MGRDPSDRSQSVPKAPLLDGAERGVVREEVGQQVAAVVAQTREPAEVVEPGVVDLEVVEVVTEGSGRALGETQRGVADADDPLAEHRLHRLGHEPRGVGEVDDPRVGRQTAYAFGDVERDRHRAQAVADPARSGRLLAEEPEVERDPLVSGAALDASDPHRGEDEVGAGERRVEVGRRRDRGRRGRGGRVQRGLGGEDLPHDVEPCAVRVVEHDLGDAPVRGVAQQRTVDERHAEPAPAEDDQASWQHHPRTVPRCDDGATRRSRRQTLAPGTKSGHPAYVGVNPGESRTGVRDHGGVPLNHTFDPLASRRTADEPSLDVFVWGTVFLDMIFAGLPSAPKPGTEVWAEGLASCPGGIANLAVATRRLGLRTGLAAAFSDDDYGDFCWRTLEEQEGIDLARSRRFADWHSPVTVSMSVDRDRSMVSHGHPAPVAAAEPHRHAPAVARGHGRPR